MEEKDWIPESYREDPSFKDYKDLESVFKTYKEQESMLGSRIKIPDESDDKQYSDFVEKLRPKSLDEYGIEAKDDATRDLLQSLYDNGLTKRQAKALVGKLSEVGTKQQELSYEKDKQYKEKAFQELVKEYGSEENATNAIKEVKDFLDKTVGKKYPDFLEFLENATIKVGEDELALANHPAMARALKVMVDMTKDDDKDIKGEPSVSNEDLKTQWLGVIEKMSSHPNNYSAEYQNLIKEKEKIEALLSKQG